MTDAAINPLETAVLQEICKQLHPQDRAALEEQMKGITFQSRENTGAGFFARFAIEKKTTQQIHNDTKGYYVTAKINGLEDAMGFILWTKVGYVDCLEGYTMALKSTAGMDFATIEFESTAPPAISD